MTTRPLTPELYEELVVDLEELNTGGNTWARSWLQILNTVTPDARIPVLAGLIRGLPALYADFAALSMATANRLLEDTLDFDGLAGIEVPPKPPSVPDSLGALFEPLALEEE